MSIIQFCVRTLSSVLLILAITPYLFGQTPPADANKKIIPPSPDASAFAKYGNIPVSPYTGVPNISIPIYEIKVRDITVPISISYHASGIKVSEEASRVGLGWVLNSGGVISRNIVGRDDFFQDVRGYLNESNNAPIIPMGPEYVPVENVQGGSTLRLLNTLNLPNVLEIDLEDDVYGDDVDFEPDQFNYNFQGYSGKFVLSRDAQAILEKQKKIKITPVANGASWEILTDDGFKYIFGDSEYYIESGEGGSTQLSAWYLTEILSPQGEQVTFHYTSIPSQYIKPVGHFQETVQGNMFSCSAFACTIIPDRHVALPVKQYFNIYLSKIEWKNGKVEFDLGEREDIVGDQKVQSLSISERIGQDEFKFIKKVEFGYEYFDNLSTGNTFPMPDILPEYLRKRLKLVSLTETSGDENSQLEQKHLFSYYETAAEDKLPNKNSYARDHWGYYNGKNENLSLIPSYSNVLIPNDFLEISGIMGPQRNPTAGYARAYALKEIIYPTGGKTTFDYESNDFELTPLQGGESPEIYQVPQFTPNYSVSQDGGTVKISPLDLTAQYVSQTGSLIPIEIEAAFVGNNPCDFPTNASDIYFEFGSEDGTALPGTKVSLSRSSCESEGQIDCLYCDPNQSSYGAKVYKGFVTLQPGKYTLRVHAPASETNVQTISVKVAWWADSRKRSPLGPNIKFAYGGGMRIQKIADFDPITNKVTNVRRFEYNYDADTDEDGVAEHHSFGRRMVYPNYTYFDVRWERKDLIVPATCYECIYIMRQSDSFLPVTGSQGYAVGYDKVLEYFGLEGENGRIEYTFENQPDAIINTIYPYDELGVRMRPPVVTTNPNPLNGSLLTQTNFNSSGIPLTKITNHYFTKYSKTIYGIENRRVVGINFGAFDYAEAHARFGNNAEVLLNIYPATQSHFQFLSSTTETNYNSSGQETFSVTTNYFYDNPDHLQLTKSEKEKSDGHKVITTFKYPADYNENDADPAIASMKNMHIHNNPVEIKVLDEGQGSAAILDHSITVFGQFGSKIFPKESAKLIVTEPLDPNTIPAYTPSTNYDVNLYKKEFSFDYNEGGNVQTIQKEDDMPMAYIWGYNQTLPIAQIRNAFPQDVFYTSFEEDGELFIDAVSNNLAKTGEKVRSASIFEFPSTYTPDEGNTSISYWYWKNDTWVFSGVIPFQRTITTDGTKLDEIRAYPKMAQMTTYTYKRLMGLTSATDPNNLTTYYQYDSFGRLETVKDSDQNIVKRYKYHYQNEQ